MFVIFSLFACHDKGNITDSASTEEPVREQNYILDGVSSWESMEASYTTGGAFADIDNDGDMDVLVAEGNDMSPGFIRVYHNENGQLPAEASWSSSTAHFYGHMSVGDLNGDGWVDVVASRFLGDAGFDSVGGVSVFLNSEGQLSSVPDWSWEGAYSFSCALGDVNNDGDLDLALAVGEAYYHEPDYSMVFENDGSAQFSLLWEAEVPRHSFDVGWVDLNTDGYLDLVFANAESPHVAYFSDLGTLPNQPTWEASDGPFEGNTLDFGDVNGDGVPDLLISDNNQLGGLGTVRLFCGPTLELCWETSEPSQMWSAVSIHDVDGDADLDLLAGAWWGAVQVFDNADGQVSSSSYRDLGHDEMVVEALSWGSLSESDAVTLHIQGSGLVSVPRGLRPEWVNAGVLGDGYISGPEIDATVVVSSADLLLTDWVPTQGNVIFERTVQSDTDVQTSDP